MILKDFDIFDNAFFFIASREKQYIIDRITDCVEVVESEFIKFFLGEDGYFELVNAIEQETTTLEQEALRQSLTVPVAGLAYYFYRKQNVSSTDETGESMPMDNKIKQVTPGEKMTTAWNMAVKAMEQINPDAEIPARINTWNL